MYPFFRAGTSPKKGFHMKTVNGTYTSAKIFTDDIEDYALAQIQMLCNNPAFQGSKIRIMPDVHPGKVGTIGFTAIIGDKILPNVVGIDVGCGITLVKLKQKKIEFQKLDRIIRETIPSGASIRRSPHRFCNNINLQDLRCADHIQKERAERSLGSLGGGNHFLEVDQDENGYLYIAVHSGSRYLGKAVTEYYLNQGQKYLKEKGIEVPYELTFLEGQLREDYLHDMVVLQDFAEWNRQGIIDELVKGMKWKVMETWSSVHNYIDFSYNIPILRKGAVSAKNGEIVVIPVNMRDGILLGTGLGNEDWNYSAPHGAGRILKRKDVKERFTVSDFKKEMKGIYCPYIGKDILDEVPFAYRRKEEILEKIQDTVKVEEILKPVYNFKAGQEN